MTKKRKMTLGEYLVENGAYCPFCRSVLLKAVGPVADCRQKMHCHGCGKEWYEVYNLIGYEEL